MWLLTTIILYDSIQYAYHVFQNIRNKKDYITLCMPTYWASGKSKAKCEGENDLQMFLPLRAIEFTPGDASL